MSTQKTFRLMPISIDCAYAEGVYDPETKSLVLFSKTARDTFHMIPKLDDNGDLQLVGGGKGRPNKKHYREERKFMQTFMEFIIYEKTEVEEMIKALCENADSYDYKQYTDAIPSIVAPTEGPKIELINKD